MRAASLFAAVVFTAGIACAEPAPQKQLDSVKQDLAKSKETEATLKKQLEATEQDMQRLRARAADLAEKLQNSERRVSNEEEALAKVSADYATKRTEFETRKADYATTVVSLLRMRNLPPTAMFSSSEDTQELLRTASVLEKTNAAVAAKATRLRNDMATIKRLQSEATLRDVRTRAEKANLKQAKEDLAKELTARQKLQSKLSSDHEKAEDEVATLSKQSESLQELIGKLETRKKGAPATKQTASLRSFEGKKGSLKAPVEGKIIHRFGEPQGANGTYRGMVFKARAGATVVAPYDGEVAFTGPFRDYGNMVLIKHKNGYISLIAGLGQIGVSLGQAAIRGEPLGTMPESGEAHAYVELRGNDAKPIDPANWFANVVSKSAQQ